MSEQENFEKLQKLLKLKRYEVPPPGYFNNFSTQVINRLEADARANRREPAFRKFLRLLETNPIAAGVFGMSICGFLISGITYSQRLDLLSASNTANPNLGVDLASATPTTSNAGWTKNADTIVASTDPVLSTNIPGAMFNAFDSLGVQQVSYAAGH